MKTLEEFEKEIEEKARSLYRSSSCHCDTTLVSRFTASKSKRFVAYKMLRLYEEYSPGHDTDYCQVVVEDLLEGKERSTGMVKYHDSGGYGFGDYYSKEDYIDSILEVSDEGKVKYKTSDGLEHLLE